MARLIQTNTEVIWFDIAMNEMTVVDVFDPLDHLVDQHEYGFQ